ncbi:hypothetical protein QQ045_005354 [Rhodiola kirilowii]
MKLYSRRSELSDDNKSVSPPSPISSSSSSSIGAPSDDESEGEGEDDEVQTSESGPERIELAESNRAAEEEVRVIYAHKEVTETVMTSKKVIAICQFGGEFFADEDGSMSMVYNGGNAYAIHLDDQTNLNDFRREVAKPFDLDVSAFPSSISFSYINASASSS